MFMDQEKVSQQMEGALRVFKEEIATIRTGRASPALIENIEVSVYGGQEKMKLAELGTISVEEARTLAFQPWDKTIINEIKNGILQTGAGFNPIISESLIRIQLPVLTTEQRENYLKLLGKKLEAVKIMIRNVRSEVRRQLQDQNLSEDELFQEEKKLQEITDNYIEKLDQAAQEKEAEIKGPAS